MPSAPAALRKCLQLLVVIGGITAMSGILVITREVLVRQLFGRDYISTEKYQSLLQELENISRAVLSVESQAVTLSQDLELLKRSARHILSSRHRRSLPFPHTVQEQQLQQRQLQEHHQQQLLLLQQQQQKQQQLVPPRRHEPQQPQLIPEAPT